MAQQQPDLFSQLVGTTTSRRTSSSKGKGKATTRKRKAGGTRKPRASKARTTADSVIPVKGYSRKRGRLPGRYPEGHKIKGTAVGGRFKKGA